jgi:anti-sigma regulatory factor (Ser/Thr protein kinase)
MVYAIENYDGFKRAIDEICAYLSSCGVSSEKVFDCRLISYELIGNVLQHSDGGAQFQVELEGEFVCISVKAEQAYCPPERAECPATSEERGRGIYLVDSFSAERSFLKDGVITVKVSIV